MATSVQVQGLSDLVARLKALPAELASKNGGPVRRALSKAARVIKDEAAVIVNANSVDTGTLLKAISTFRDKNPQAKGATEIYRVGIRKMTKAHRVNSKKKHGVEPVSPGRYFHLVEFGTARAAPEPFLRPAFDSKKDEALAVFSTELARGVKAAERKLAKQERGVGT